MRLASIASPPRVRVAIASCESCDVSSFAIRMACAKSTCPSYSARPMMTPLSPASRTRCTSSRLAHAARGDDARGRWPRPAARVASTFTPLPTPSRAMSVKIEPAPAHIGPLLRQIDGGERSQLRCQPRTRTMPSRASMPTAMRSGPNASQCRPAPTRGFRRGRAQHHARHAQVERAANRSISRIPPPNCTRSRAAEDARQRRLVLLPPSPNAPSRLTTCSHVAPASCQRRATAQGSVSYCVSRPGSPCFSRTTRPRASRWPDRSMNVVHQIVLPYPLHKIPQHTQPNVLALFRVELDASRRSHARRPRETGRRSR